MHFFSIYIIGKGARVVEWNGLENRHIERYRGFESPPFRFIFVIGKISFFVL